MLKVCALLVVLLPCFSGYPTGPPPTYDVCHNMYPYEKLGHHVYSQNEYPKYGEPRDGPYDIVPEKTEYRARERMKVKIVPTDFQHYVGFIIQARRAICPGRYEGAPLGRFSVEGVSSELARAINCDNQVANTVVHSTRQWKNDVEMIWSAPDRLVGHIVFIATVVRDDKTYWTGVNSTVVEDPTAPPLPECDSASFLTVSITSILAMATAALQLSANRY